MQVRPISFSSLFKSNVEEDPRVCSEVDPGLNSGTAFVGVKPGNLRTSSNQENEHKIITIIIHVIGLILPR